MKSALNLTGIILLLAVSNLSAATLYVSLGSTNPTWPYATTATAATNIQDAVGAAAAGDEIVVDNGVYDGGLAVVKPLALRSVNGPQFTIISGGGPCVLLTDGASLSGFTLTNGVSAGGNGGGVSCTSTNAFLTNCMLSGNWAVGSSHHLGAGGGAYGGTLYNCTLAGNSASDLGGAAYLSTLYNCTLTGNSAQGGHGSGVVDCRLYNCIVYYNMTSEGTDYDASSILNYCCTTPQPTTGVGNITNAPTFADGNLRLPANSPCINAGNNAYVSGTADLDGNARIRGGTVDIGAYEFQLPVSTISYAWLQQFGLAINASTDSSDPDGDGMNNWQEWVAGTDPTDATSQLRLLTPACLQPSLLLRWNSDTNHVYFVERANSLQPPLTFSLLGTNVPGLSGVTSFTDTTPLGTGAALYRIGTASTNASPPLRLQRPVFMPASVVVGWTSVTNRSYFLERAADLTSPMLFAPLATNVPGQSGTTTFTDTSAAGPGPWLYRVGVSAP